MKFHIQSRNCRKNDKILLEIYFSRSKNMSGSTIQQKEITSATLAKGLPGVQRTELSSWNVVHQGKVTPWKTQISVKLCNKLIGKIDNW